MTTHSSEFSVRRIDVNGTAINVATAGSGPAILFLHGWPHTWEIWREVMDGLKADHTVIAPDLRGLGGSERSQAGYDLHTLADDAAGVLDAFSVKTASIVGIDLGTAISWMSAMRHPDRIDRLVVMEGLVGNLPGAEDFLQKGPPWWFGFHGVPGFAEAVLEGNEARYIDWFLHAGTKDRRGIAPARRQAFIDAYSNRDAMRCGFEHYRAFPENARQVAAIAAGAKATLPILAISGGAVGDALAGQLRPISLNLSAAAIADCAHLVPLEQPALLLEELRRFLG